MAITPKMNLLINSDACTGCRLCELVCSIVKEKESNPAKSRIYIEVHMMEGLRIPRVCVDCNNPPCVKACTKEALRKDDATGFVILNYDKCDHCGDCVPACPFGGIRLTPEDMVIKCDLCNGSPQCVEVCEPKAIQFVERKRQKLTRARRGLYLESWQTLER